MNLAPIVDSLLAPLNQPVTPKQRYPWETKDVWLAELVVALMEERGNVKFDCDATNCTGHAQGIIGALRDFNLSLKQFEKLKRRLEK